MRASDPAALLVVGEAIGFVEQAVDALHDQVDEALEALPMGRLVLRIEGREGRVRHEGGGVLGPEGLAEAERVQERARCDPELPKLPEHWKKVDFSKLVPSPHGSPVSVTGRSTYAESAPTVVAGVMPGQVALCIPSPPKIITEDLKKLCKVAYLGLPEYNEKLWFHGKSQYDFRTKITALAA